MQPLKNIKVYEIKSILDLLQIDFDCAIARAKLGTGAPSLQQSPQYHFNELIILGQLSDEEISCACAENECIKDG